jgi:hypothetical protein
MSNAAILYPVFVQVALTFILLLAMGRARVGAIKKREVKVGEIALGQIDPWPERPKAIARSFHNQLETPILFYAVVAIALAVKAVTPAMVMVAWAYVVIRLIHAAIHISRNTVSQRFIAFLASVALLIAMWVLLAWHVIATGA